jgi:pimeloyl-ACP methyl ester carboxylesterase
MLSSPVWRLLAGWRLPRRLAVWGVGLLLLSAVGCAAPRYVSTRTVRENPLASTLQLMRYRGPQVSPRTAAVLQRYGLDQVYEQEPSDALARMLEFVEQQAGNERLFAVAELAYIEGKKADRKGLSSKALDHYTLALTNSYQYLFSPQLEPLRNPYDPQFRGACDLYNQAFEDSLRLLCAEKQLKPGQTYTIETPDRNFTIETIARGDWDVNELERFEFVSDFRVETLRNRHTTYGLGVPMVAVRRPQNPADPREKHYPEGLSYAVTAMLRCVQPLRGSQLPQRCILEFYDPLSENQIQLAKRWVPLETDLTTPLAYFLDSPQFRKRNLATEGLINPAGSQEHRGLYLLEPYDPERIPVVMVHGLWSSPLTWMDMFNDLRSFPEIRQRYQFCFYMYPSGQPFWTSAAQMRQDLAEMRNTFDPAHRDAAMDQMVLVGHSMGGLISRMQSLDSRDDFWKIVSDKPFEALQAEEEDVAKLASVLRFRPNQSVQRVITIATPHRGSEFANEYTRWLARKLIKLPTQVVETGVRLTRQNPDLFNDSKLLTVSNAIDSLAPDSPIFPVMLNASSDPDVKYHNIVGLVEESTLFGRISRGSDGVVEYESAHLEDVESELVVTGDHMTVHTLGQSVMEVRRILLKHLREVDAEDRLATREGSLHSPDPVRQTSRQETLAEQPVPVQAAAARD